MLAACLQLDIEDCKPEENLKRSLALAEAAVSKGAKILVFPELFLTGFCYEMGPEDPPYPSLDPYIDLSKACEATVIGTIMSSAAGIIDDINQVEKKKKNAGDGPGRRGPGPKESAKESAKWSAKGIVCKKTGTMRPAGVTGDQDRYNLGFCIDGDSIDFFSKIHPFGPEKDCFLGGERIEPLRSSRGLVGLEICYDLRFPEVARALTLGGADLLVTVAQFPAERIDHWRTLCLARAVENQIHHLACNWAKGGHSMVVDPWGEVLAEAGTGEATVLGEVDLGERDRVRKALCCLEDRRPDLYRRSMDRRLRVLEESDPEPSDHGSKDVGSTDHKSRYPRPTEGRTADGGPG